MIRFVNDSGIGHDTRIVDAETGEDLTKTLAIEYGGKVTIGNRVTAELSICFMAIDVTAETTIWKTKHPVSGDYVDLAAMEFRDGTRVEFAEDGSPAVKTGAAQPPRPQDRPDRL